MEPMDCPETSVGNYHSTLCKISKERKSQILSISNRAYLYYYRCVQCSITFYIKNQTIKMNGGV
jgi:predicted nucleic-acid-binding Zn-ribbon protein